MLSGRSSSAMSAERSLLNCASDPKVGRSTLARLKWRRSSVDALSSRAVVRTRAFPGQSLRLHRGRPLKMKPLHCECQVSISAGRDWRQAERTDKSRVDPSSYIIDLAREKGPPQVLN